MSITACCVTRSPRAFSEGSESLDALAYDLLSTLHSPYLRSFLQDWPAAESHRAQAPTSVPVLRYLPQLRIHPPPFSASLIEALAAAAASLTWRRSYVTPDVSAQFLDNYGWTELVGLTGALAAERLACGVLLLGPHTRYPAHHHEAEEIYVPLAGSAQWQHGNRPWREQAPGSVIHHARQESHAMRTSSLPLLALYLWRSCDLAQKSQLDG